VDESATAALRGVETVELIDLPQRVSDVTGALTTITQQESSFDSQLPMRETLGLNEALTRTRGALVDNLAKLSQLDADITQAEQELGRSEAANYQEKKRRIQELPGRLRDERASRLESAAANRDALRSQISRIRETIERALNADTTLAERLRTLFRQQGVTIASILKTLSGWLKTLAEKATAALPGVIAAIVSWLLKTAGSVAVWLAEHLWAAVLTLVAAAAVYYRQR